MEKDLIQLGFSPEEAKIYLAVLGLGQTTAGPVVKKTGLHRQRVYDNIDKLKQKDMISETVKSNRRNWTAASPSRIMDMLKSKEKMANQLLPGLFGLEKLADHKQEVKIYEGVKGFRASHWTNIENQPVNTTVGTIGSTMQIWVDAWGTKRELKKYEQERIRKNIKHEPLFSEKVRKDTEKIFLDYYAWQPPSKRKKFRYLPEEFDSPVGIQVWHDNVTLVIFSEKLLLVKIKNKMVQKNFQTYYKMLRRLAKE